MKSLSSLFLPKTPHKTHTALFTTKPNMSATSATLRRNRKLVLIIGPTGCGKSKLSIDLATRFFPSSEIINSDKIQIHRGLDITTNKITHAERRGVRHHFLGEYDSIEVDFTPSDYRLAASLAISQIVTRRKVPFVVGGSNSFIYALLAKRFNPEVDVFAESEEGGGGGGSGTTGFCKEIRYDCCFIWIDVFQPVLNQYLSQRVDEMLELGMFDELREYFETRPESHSAVQCGLNKAIGVPEFRRYYEKLKETNSPEEASAAYEEAVRAIKDNTFDLAKRQVRKIQRLREEAGWEMHRVDATASFRARMSEEASWRWRTAEIWEREVMEPSVKAVKEFLMKE